MVCLLVEERNYSEENLSQRMLSMRAGTRKVPGIEPEKINLHISKYFIFVSKGTLCCHQKEKRVNFSFT